MLLRHMLLLYIIDKVCIYIQAKYSSMDGWIYKCSLYPLWNALNLKFLSFPTIWMDLEDIVLSEISQHRKAHTTYSYLCVKSQTVKVLAVESENSCN